MRVFIAGATGAIGRALVPRLLSGGHDVIGTTTTPGKLESLRASGAEAVLLDGLDRDAVMRAVRSAHPDVIVHQMTALASMKNLKHFDQEFALTNRLRTEGTAYLLDAARAAGTRRIVVQSYSGWPNARTGNGVKTEEDALDATPPQAMQNTLDAIRTLEAGVSSAEGVTGTVLRYGSLYGPGTSLARDGEIVKLVRQRRFPLIGSGAGIWSFLHVHDAARATMLAVERSEGGVFNIVDDEPAEVSVWLPELARAVGARPPMHLPAWVGRLAIGEAGVCMMTAIRGSSNEKARRVLGWEPEFESWREGFRTGL